MAVFEPESDGIETQAEYIHEIDINVVTGKPVLQLPGNVFELHNSIRCDDERCPDLSIYITAEFSQGFNPADQFGLEDIALKGYRTPCRNGERHRVRQGHVLILEKGHAERDPLYGYSHFCLEGKIHIRHRHSPFEGTRNGPPIKSNGNLRYIPGKGAIARSEGKSFVQVTRKCSIQTAIDIEIADGNVRNRDVRGHGKVRTADIYAHPFLIARFDTRRFRGGKVKGHCAVDAKICSRYT